MRGAGRRHSFVQYGGLFAAAIMIIGSLWPSRAAQAATYQGSALTTSPIAVNLTIKPGTTASTDIQVQNSSGRSETIDVKLEKFTVSGTTGQPSIYKADRGDQSVDWVSFSSHTFTLQPKEWHTLTMTIAMPEGATLGYYYAVLLEPHVAPSAPGNKANIIKGANAVLVLADTASKNEHKQLTIQNLTSAHGVYEYLPANFQVEVRNTGNIHLIPSGDIYISRTKNGHTLATLDLNPGLGNVLPDSSRIFSTSWSDGFPVYQTKRQNGQVVSDKHGKPVQELDWNFSQPLSKFRFGKYYAHLVLVYSNGLQEVPVNGYVSFWVIPWRLLATIILIPVVIVALTWYAAKRWQARIKAEAAEAQKAPKAKKGKSS